MNGAASTHRIGEQKRVLALVVTPLQVADEATAARGVGPDELGERSLRIGESEVGKGLRDEVRAQRQRLLWRWLGIRGALQRAGHRCLCLCWCGLRRGSLDRCAKAAQKQVVRTR